MTIAFRSLLKSIALGVAMLVVIGASYTSARADELTISGFTTFLNSVPNLAFTPTPSFNGTTSLGIGSLSGPNSLGTFSLATAPAQLVGGAFQLDITFLTPTGITGGQGA